MSLVCTGTYEGPMLTFIPTCIVASHHRAVSKAKMAMMTMVTSSSLSLA